VKANGTNAVNGSAGFEIQALKVTYRDRGLVFRYFPDATCKELRWQAGRNVLDNIVMPNGEVRLLARFELCAWAATRNELINQLA
jgi:hypothetical protein